MRVRTTNRFILLTTTIQPVAHTHSVTKKKRRRSDVRILANVYVCTRMHARVDDDRLSLRDHSLSLSPARVHRCYEIHECLNDWLSCAKALRLVDRSYHLIDYLSYGRLLRFSCSFVRINHRHRKSQRRSTLNRNGDLRGVEASASTSPSPLARKFHRKLSAMPTLCSCPRPLKRSTMNDDAAAAVVLVVVVVKCGVMTPDPMKSKSKLTYLPSHSISSAMSTRTYSSSSRVYIEVHGAHNRN